MTYLHTLDPFAIQFTDSGGIRWYGLSYLAGFVLGFYLIRWATLRGRTYLKINQVEDFVTWVAIGTVLGGRLGYCALYDPALLGDLSAEFPYWGALKIWQGGMASHGGIIGIICACCYFGYRHRIAIPHLFDLTTIAGTVGIFFGRIANFINGELPGREAPAGFPFIVKFPQDILAWPSYEPERLGSLAPAAELVRVPALHYLDVVAASPGDPIARGELFRVLDKIILAVQSGNTQVAQALEPVLTGRYPSQLIASFGEGLLVCLILLFAWRRPQKPGVIAGIFFVCYAVVRICTEQFRLPDLQIGYQLWGLTRGQWLSLAMVGAGVAYLAWATIRRADKVGGWRTT